MTDSPPSSLLITPDARRRLQQRYEEAQRLRQQAPCDHRQVHDLLAECLRADPGNILYLESLVANLRQWEPTTWRTWLPRWLGATPQPRHRDVQAQALAQLQAAPDRLLTHYRDSAVLAELATAAGECQLEEVELVYWQEAVSRAPGEMSILRGLAQALAWSGRFDEALEVWRKVAALSPDEEASQAIDDLARGPLTEEAARPPLLSEVNPSDLESALDAATQYAATGDFQTAEQILWQTQSAAGGNLRVREAHEALQLARSEHRVEIARRRAASDSHPRAAALVGRMEQEHNRLEIDILHVRSERHPDDPSLRLELARRLQKAGNFSGAIQRLEEARADPGLAPEANLLLGECWQRLRQFGKALDFYRQAVALAETCGGSADATLASALYRRGVLAAAMDQPAEARGAFGQLLAIDPAYKDARERLDNLG